MLFHRIACTVVSYGNRQRLAEGHQYVKAVLDTQLTWLTVYVKGRVFKRWPYNFLDK